MVERIVASIAPYAGRIPGLLAAYKWATSRRGDGRIYTFSSGPMAGLRWRRDNRLPYWYHRGLYERRISAFLAARLRPGDCYWDIGAHAGYHVLLAARAVGRDGVVVAVEPDPANCAVLREQLRVNDVADCTVVEAAVANQVGRSTLILQDGDSRGNRLESARPHPDHTYRGAIDVETVTLDSLAQRLPTPWLLKIDVEGAESLVLEGGAQLFAGPAGPAHVLIEVHGDEEKESCRGLLERHDYTILPGRERGGDQYWLIAERS